jgi:trehalose synthase-fused probable maltokinase
LAEGTELPDALSSWVARQRWYGGKGGHPRLESRGSWTIETPDARIVTHYLLDRGRGATTLYQVPLTERQLPIDGLPPIFVAAGIHVYDAPHDPAYAPALLAMMFGEQAVEGALGQLQPGVGRVQITDSAVLTGEQSNTSIICQVESGEPIIVKVFRALHHGDNPDVVLQSAIAAAGSTLVPRSIGSVAGGWQDSGQPNGFAHGHLAFAQEFLIGAEDAWRVALRAASANESFVREAEALGRATAEVHADLATALPTRDMTTADIDVIIRGMHARLDGAISEVPQLATAREPIERTFERARAAAWPSLQRIHGDFHLGQVLAVPNRGWVLVDFEGEPLRAMAERSEPDIALRDVAGMLRSFDYVAGSVERGTHGGSPREWAATARDAFVAGYSARSGMDVAGHPELIEAFELDKALYEAVYEARSRPDWIEIPVSAIHRLAENVDRNGR